ncbi:hypothetical protein [Micromonospora matsumotoense]|uniref:hypothetical protein n=1 Tax=Micromonospora matsumotoense TaxID=121616 RepID=UPI001C40841F
MVATRASASVSAGPPEDVGNADPTTGERLALVLDRGRLVESGPPGALLAAGGPFVRLAGVPDALRSWPDRVS